MQQALAQSIPPLDAVETDKLESAIAAFTPDQLNWASGYLAGVAAARRAAQTVSPQAALDLTPEPQAPAAAPGQLQGLTVLYGSQTGNGQGVAETLAVKAREQGMPVRLESMADFEPRKLKSEQHVLFVVSTHGEGDPPDDAEDLRDFLFSKKAPKLEGLNYSVLALGDSSYEQFCQTGREFDERLEALGATRVHARVDCDLDYDEPAEAWGKAALAEVAGTLEAETVPLVADTSVLHLRPVDSGPKYTEQNPYVAEMLADQKITGRGSDKDVRHVEFDLEGSGLSYEPGDSLGIVHRNPERVVEDLIDALGVGAEELLTQSGKELAFREVLTGSREITLLHRGFVERYAELSGSGELQALLADERRADLAAYMADRQVVDVVREHPADVSAAEFAGALRELTPRLYSIASSQLAHPDEVHLTVDVLEYPAFGSTHLGAASNYLAELEDANGKAPVYVERNERFRLPADTGAPVIMVGPGTGVAPFRAFVQHREAQGATGKNWLFFGARTQREDFLYQLEWLRYLKNGSLHQMDVAFSRDQDEKIYVQHRMAERGAELYEWLENGAYFYVCGDAKHMARDVHRALIDLVAREGGMSDDDAQAYVKALKRAGRYQRDVY